MFRLAIAYKKLPVSNLVLVLSLFLLMLVVWVQNGGDSIVHLLFLLSSYLTWGFLMPFIQGLVISASFDVKGFINIGLKAVIVILAHFLLSNMVYYALQYFLVQPFTPPTLALLQEIVGPSVLGRSVDFVIFFGLLSWYQRTKELNEKAMALVSTESNLQKMRLKSLQSQLNPHFFFNTLHTINALIGRNNDKAREITIKISGLLRKVIESNRLEYYTLQKELDLVNDYLSIEQERFSDRLEVTMDISPESHDILVPTFILQPLIENAFKHGIGQIEGKAKLYVSVAMDNMKNRIDIEVINDVPGTGIEISDSTGIGLSNLKERLDAFYHCHIKFSAGNCKDNTYRVAYSIPLNP